MSPEEIALISKAGEIACEAKKLAREVTRPGAKLLDIAQTIEGFIISRGGRPAFPVNVSINSEAAHYTPLADDEKRVPENSMVKVDIGVSFQGYLADTAITLNFAAELEDLVKASEEALDRAIQSIAPGIKASQVGEVIEKTIKSFGFKPIRNLSGHSMDRYLLHSGVSIPNVGGELLSPTLKPPMLVAIEPFATNGAGWVVEGPHKTIYSISRQIGKKERKLGDLESGFLASIYSERRSLPFTERWFVGTYPLAFIRSALDKAERQKIIRSYPVLIESVNGMVSQAEDTVLILSREVIVTTRGC